MTNLRPWVFFGKTRMYPGGGLFCLEKNWAVEEGHREERGVILPGRSSYKKISKSEVEGQEKNIKKLNL